MIDPVTPTRRQREILRHLAAGHLLDADPTSNAGSAVLIRGRLYERVNGKTVTDMFLAGWIRPDATGISDWAITEAGKMELI